MWLTNQHSEQIVRHTVSVEDTRALEEFSSRWKEPVYRFCRLFVGNGQAAEAATSDAFAAFYRETRFRSPSPKVLPRLVALALKAMPKSANGNSSAPQLALQLEDAIQHLPRLERAVVITRNVLHMDWDSLAKAADLSPGQAHKIWKRGIFQLNELLHRKS